MKVLADASLPNIDIIFNNNFSLRKYKKLEEVGELILDCNVLLCRSTLKVDEKLLKNSSCRVVATTTSGIDHIDENYLIKNNIQLIDAKGSNADSVCDYVISCISYLSLINKINGKNACIIGYGEVGKRLLPRLKSLGFIVSAYDPLLQDKNYDFNLISKLAKCDLICIHANLHNSAPFPSFNLFNKDVLSHLKSEAVIINASRGGIVNEADLLSMKNKIIYCTDVYINEPNINSKIIDFAKICTPHIAGHSKEAKYAGVYQAVEEIYKYFGVEYSFTKSAELKPVIYFSDLNQEEVLKYYNPITETNLLKKAKNKKAAFLEFRKSHALLR
ncbi:MAG: hypothetical protein A3E88_05470 [Legionellales bacterium RIFCSPHIGHO2_12_FULL_35_11]|nr:MAG: hypothetical protein A3E88_05470 [Legionellales bacterium RIFCSPHIGHO2_12_FULL_35_11]